MKLIFWDVKSLTISKNIEHFSRTMTVSKLKVLRMKKDEREKRSIMLKQLEEFEEDAMKNFTWKLVEKQKYIRMKRKEYINDFLSENIIPRLLEEWFFEDYVIPTKKDVMWREIKNYFQ